MNNIRETLFDRRKMTANNVSDLVIRLVKLQYLDFNKLLETILEYHFHYQQYERQKGEVKLRNVQR